RPEGLKRWLRKVRPEFLCLRSLLCCEFIGHLN
ncbi:MAG: hypothetical protein ACI8W0_000818, partial [Flavobacterium sp.]